MAKNKELEAVVSFVGNIDPSLSKAVEGAKKQLGGINLKAIAAGAAVGGIAVATGKAVAGAAGYLKDLGAEFDEAFDAIRVGTKVKTIGGFIGTVKMIDNNNKTFVLDISAQEDGSAMVTLDRSAIYMVMTPAVEGSIGTSAVAGGADAVAMDDAEMDAKSADKKSKNQEGSDDIANGAENSNDLQI